MVPATHDMVPTREGYAYRSYVIARTVYWYAIRLNGRQVQTKTTLAEAQAWVDNQLDNPFNK